MGKKLIFKKSEGIRFVEALIALAVVTVMIIVYLSSTLSSDITRHAKYRFIADHLAQEEIEALRSLDFDKLTDRTEGDFLGVAYNKGPWAVTEDPSGGHSTPNVYSVKPKIGEQTLAILPGSGYQNFILETEINVVEVYQGNWEVGFYFRYQDKNNYYSLISSSTTIYLNKKVGGVESTIYQTNTCVAVSGWHTLKIIANGNSLELFCDSWNITQTDNSFNKGFVALTAYSGATFYYDDINFEVFQGEIPTFTTTTYTSSSAADGYISNEESSGNKIAYSSTNTSYLEDNHAFIPVLEQRSYLSFDTSDIGEANTVSEAYLYIFSYESFKSKGVITDYPVSYNFMDNKIGATLDINDWGFNGYNGTLSWGNIYEWENYNISNPDTAIHKTGATDVELRPGWAHLYEGMGAYVTMAQSEYTATSCPNPQTGEPGDNCTPKLVVTTSTGGGSPTSYSWNFDTEAVGQQPKTWQRVGLYDLPSGNDKLTIESYGGNDDIKRVLVEITWKEKNDPKNIQLETLITQ